jgi:hypothetical protein
MTRIGCGFGGLKWEDVSKIVQAAADKYDIDIYVCDKPKTDPLD